MTLVASREDLQHAHRAHADHQLERARVQEVADQHRRGVAERRVGRRVAAAQLRLVDDVVVQQRRRVDHLDDGRERVVVPPLVAAGARRQQDQRRTQPLAAAADDVLGDLADQRRRRNRGSRAARDRPRPCRERCRDFRNSEVTWRFAARSGAAVGAGTARRVGDDRCDVAGDPRIVTDVPAAAGRRSGTMCGRWSPCPCLRGARGTDPAGRCL